MLSAGVFMDSQRRASPTTDLLAPRCCPRWQTSTSSIWGCARLPRPLGRQNAPLYKLSAGVFTASEENLAAKIHQQPTSSPRGVFRVGRLPPPRFEGALACLDPLVDKTPPRTSSPQVSSGPLRKTPPRRVTNNRPPRPEVFWRVDDFHLLRLLVLGMRSPFSAPWSTKRPLVQALRRCLRGL